MRFVAGRRGEKKSAGCQNQLQKCRKRKDNWKMNMNFENRMPFTEDPRLGALHNLLCSPGTEIAEHDETGILLREKHGILFVYQPDQNRLKDWLRKYQESCSLMMVLGQDRSWLQAQLPGWQGEMCRQFYWDQKQAPQLEESRLDIHPAKLQDLALIARHYDLESPEELRETAEEGRLFLFYDKEELAGFAGLHAENSMGLLYIFESMRRKHYAQEIEKRIIALVLQRGLVPYCDVFEDNAASLSLQQKLGLTENSLPVCWLHRAEEEK